MSIGKTRRLHKILPQGVPAVIFSPLDDSLLAGPTNGLEQLEFKVSEIAAAYPNAIIGFKGLIQHYGNLLRNVPIILNVTASTTLRFHTRKQLISSVEEAVSLGCEGVAVHVNISSQFEPEMLKILGAVSRSCDQLGMPLLAHMYYRSERLDGSDDNHEKQKEKQRMLYAQGVAHAVRIGVELGADIIKTQYTGDKESFRKVVSAAGPVPLVVAGGAIKPEKEAILIAKDILISGARGISFGRNVFGRKHPGEFLRKLRQLINTYKT